MKKLFVLFLQILFGLLILFLVIKTIGTKETFETIKSVKLNYIFLAFAAFLTGHAFGSIRISQTVKIFGYNISYLKGASLHFFGLLLSTITPGRLGYIGISYPMKRMGIPYSATFSYFGISQGIDMLMKIVFSVTSLIGLQYIFGFSGLTEYIINVIIILGLLGSVLLFFLWQNYLQKEKSVRKIIMRIKILHILLKRFEKIQRYAVGIKSVVPLYMMTSFVTWLFLGLQWYFVGMSLGLEMSYLVYLFLHPILGLLFFVPITPAGLGVTEIGAVFVLGIMGVSPALALSFALLIRVTEIIPSMVGLKVLFK